MMRRRWMVGFLLAVAALLIAGRGLATGYVDFLWYAALGADDLWRVRAWNQFLVVAGSAIAAVLFAAANLLLVRRSVVSLVLPRRIGNLEIGEEVPGRHLTRAAALGALLVGVLLAARPHLWITLASARYAVPFRERDPIFDYDLGFFVNWLPFEQALFKWSLTLLAVTALLVLTLYALTPSLQWQKGAGLRTTLYVRRHVGILGALAVVFLAWTFRLESVGSLIDGSGVEGAFAAVDREMLRWRTSVSVFTLVSAAFLAWSTWTDQIRLTLFTLTLVVLLSLGVHHVMPLLLATPVPVTEGGAGDRQYEALRGGRTRRAYASQEVAPAQPAADFGFTSWDGAVSGISLWDSDRFVRGVSHARGGDYVVGMPSYEPGESAQRIGVVMRSPGRLPGDSAERYYVFRGAANRLRGDGSPASTGGADSVTWLASLNISDPGARYRIVIDTAAVVPAPEFESFGSRLAHAWSLQNFRFMLAPNPVPGARILLRTDIRERVHRLVPFLTQDRTVYPIVVGDTTFWTIQLYSTSSSYPLSAPFRLNGVPYRYFRHSGVAVVNAVTGESTVFIVDGADPVAQAWRARFPRLYRSTRELPSVLSALLPPPIDGAIAQSQAYARYGSRHDSEAGGSVAAATIGLGVDLESYSLVHFPALTPVAAWVVLLLDATGRASGLFMATGGSYPQSYVLELSRHTAWYDVEQRLAAVRDSIVASGAGEVSPGATRALLVGRNLALIRPFYGIRAGALPTIIAVSVAERDSIRTAPTLAIALGTQLHTALDQPLSAVEFRERVDGLYEQMRGALRRGDLTAFAELFEALGRLLGGAGRDL